MKNKYEYQMMISSTQRLWTWSIFTVTWQVNSAGSIFIDEVVKKAQERRGCWRGGNNNEEVEELIIAKEEAEEATEENKTQESQERGR